MDTATQGAAGGRRSRRAAMALAGALAAGTATASLSLSLSPAGSAQTAPTTTTTTVPRYPCCFPLQAEPATGLHDGDVVRITAGRPAGPEIREASAALCRSGPGNGEHADEGWGHECFIGSIARERLSPSEVVLEQRVFTGTRRFSGPAYPVEITCDETHPCTIGVRVTPADTTRHEWSQYWYGSVRVSFAPGSATTTSTSSTTSISTSTSTTTTARPGGARPHPLCRYQAQVPAWLWHLLASVLDIDCLAT